ncbi:MAG: hypothetical protein HRU38_16455 [Saccharospirillaceae bacterium]|nr:hypothetical protein [Saccharospirillaceae bacterium]
MPTIFSQLTGRYVTMESLISTSDYDERIEILEKKYQEILGKFDLSKIYSDEHLSGIFLAKPDPSYFSSDRKVLIVGQETRGWRKETCKIRNGHSNKIEAIRDSMDASLQFNYTEPKKSRFRQFYKKASVRLNKTSANPRNSAVWANQFCMSFKGKSPRRSSSFKDIQQLSSLLLKAQFEILKPDVAIFTVGSARDFYIK